MIALARPIRADEREDALHLLEQLAGSHDEQHNEQRIRETLGEIPDSLAALPPRQAASLVKLCLAVYNLNEFAFVD